MEAIGWSPGRDSRSIRGRAGQPSLGRAHDNGAETTGLTAPSPPSAVEQADDGGHRFDPGDRAIYDLRQADDRPDRIDDDRLDDHKTIDDHRAIDHHQAIDGQADHIDDDRLDDHQAADHPT
ncbi:MAG: hypothetical protein AAFO29_23290, partial [Actinomycetota bacterium]